MKKTFQLAKASGIVLAFAFVLISNFAFAGGMSGTYTIDPSKAASGTNFQSFKAAFASLQANGTSDTVLIKVADGTYKENIKVDSLNGTQWTASFYQIAATAFPVTFTSASGDSTKVILTNKTPGKTLYLEGTFDLTFDKLTIGNASDSAAIVLNSGGYINFQNCILKSDIVFNAGDIYGGVNFFNNELGNIADYWVSIDSLVFKYNHFNNSYVYFADITAKVSMTFDSNTFVNSEISLNEDAMGGTYAVIRNNTFNQSGISEDAADGVDAIIYNNYFNSTGFDAISVATESGANIYNNIIIGNIEFYSGYSYALFVNNTIVGNIFMYGTPLYGGSPRVPDFVNNIISGNVTFDNSSGVFFFYGTIQDYDFSRWKNNSYKNPYFHYIAIAGGAGADSDFITHSLATWQNNTFGGDSNSKVANPHFINLISCIPTDSALDGAAIHYKDNQVDITDDYYYKKRGTKPDIGAVEFTPGSKIYTDDIAVNYFSQPSSCGSDSAIIGVDIENNGSTSQTGFTIKTSVAGSSSKASFTFSKNLAPGQDTIVYFGFSPALNTFNGGQFDFTSYSATDSNALNDTARTTLDFTQGLKIKSFATSPISICSAKDTIRLYDSTVLPAGYSRQWSFGDGYGDTGQSVKHMYAKPGKYTIGLYIYGTCSQYASATVLYDTTCVWPGDANRDKVVDASDVLNIGLAFGKTGPARLYATTLWYGQPCTNWKDSFGVGVNYKQADCNGDSTIGYSDTLAITANYSKTHRKTLSRTQGKSTDAPLQIVLNKDSAQVGDIITADVYLGTKTTNIKNIYGLCFGMNFNSALIDTNSVSIDYTPNWFAAFGKNQLHFSKDLFGADRMDFAMTRIDHTNTSGFGKICSIKMKVSNAVPKTGTKLNFTFSNNKQINAGGKYIPVYMSDDSIIVKQLLTGVENSVPSVSSLNVYPNPFKGFTNIEYSLFRDEKVLVEVFDMTGRRIALLASEDQISGIHNLKFESNSIAGQYILRIQTRDQVVYKQIVGLK